MDYIEKCRRIANSYYNQGLEKAGIRDLTGAAECLKKSLHFYKYQTDARNLLGLIYYEIGETAQALVQWVISTNLQPEKNRAVHYLHEIQGKPGRLEAESANIRKYNQALFQAQNGSEDLAILQLSRVVEYNPHFIKAHLVLALLYMSREDFTKAGKSLYKVLQIDKNHPKALWYMSIVKANTGRAEIERRKLKNAFSHRQMQDDDIILPPTYRETTGWLTILNILAGLVLGAAVIFFLVMPASREELNARHNQELIRVMDQLSQRDLDITELEDQLAAAQEELGQAQQDLQNIGGVHAGELGQYQILVQIVSALRGQDVGTAAVLYTDWDPSQITAENMQGTIAQIQEELNAAGGPALQQLGDAARDAGNADQALDYYERSLRINGDNPQVLYDMALLRQARGEEEQADQLFGQVILNYPDTELAEAARTARGY